MVDLVSLLYLHLLLLTLFAGVLKDSVGSWGAGVTGIVHGLDRRGTMSCSHTIRVMYEYLVTTCVELIRQVRGTGLETVLGLVILRVPNRIHIIYRVAAEATVV